MSGRAFARQHHVSGASLYSWRKRLDASPTPSSTLAVSAPAVPRLVSLTVSAPAALCELALRSGRVLRFDPALDPDRLHQIVRVCEAP
jgi:hypothetical protein